MLSRRIVEAVAAAAVLVFASGGFAADLPASFPGDVPVADYMVLAGVTEVGNSMMVDLHAPDKTVEDVVDWFKSGLTAAGWESEGEQVSASDAILAYRKNGRRCGVVVTNFVLNGSMQMDDTTKGITLQITGASVPDDGSTDSASEAGDTISD